MYLIKSLVPLLLVSLFCCRQVLAADSYVQVLKKYQQALTIYKSHRRLFQQNVSSQNTSPQSQDSDSAIQAVLGGNAAPPLDYKISRIPRPEDSSLANLVERDSLLTATEEELGGQIEAVLGIRDKISQPEYAAAWRALFNKAIESEKSVVSLNTKLTANHAQSNGRLTAMVHQAERDGDGREMNSTYLAMKETKRVDDALFQHADIHSKIALDLKNTLLANKPPGVVDQFGMLIEPESSQFQPEESCDDNFSRLDIPSQQKQLDQEYDEVERLFREVDQMSRNAPESRPETQSRTSR